MTDQVLAVLRILFLGLVYLFFARVLWSVWSEVRSPVANVHGSAGATGMFGGRKVPRAKGALTLVIVEPRTRRGEAFVLSNTVTVGRDADNDVSIPDDSFMSGRHARLEVRPDGSWLVDLGSTNGTFVNGQLVDGDRSLRRGDRIQVGATVLEVRA